MLPCLYLSWREVKGRRHMFEISFVRTITKRFVGRLTTTAERNNRSSLQTIRIGLSVDNLKVAFDFDRAVVVDYDFCHVNMVAG